VTSGRIATGSVSVIMPAYNESEHIAKNVSDVVRLFESFGVDFEVIVVDDGSSDNTLVHARSTLGEHPDRIRVVFYDINQGKGNALVAGVKKAQGEYVVFLDADMDLHPRQLPAFFEIMESQGADAVIGSKWHPLSQVEYPRVRRFYSKCYYAMIRVLFGLPVRDTQAGLKLLRMALLRDVLPSVRAKRFAFDVELLAIAHARGYVIADAPVSLSFARPLGRVAFRDAWATLLETLAIFCRLKLLRSSRAKTARSRSPIGAG
jgi:glycosyltransferase involved in cell wall biosynthesis